MGLSPEFFAKRIEPFQYLWKTDDKEWMKQRRADWKRVEDYLVENGESKKTIRKYKNLFIYGKQDAYIGELVVFVAVPITSPQEARELFWSDVFDLSSKNRIANSYLVYATLIGRGLPWLRRHLQLFVQGVLGDEYRLIEVERNNGLKKAISPGPSGFASDCMHWMVKLLSGEVDYHGCMEAVDYFVSALAHADDPDFRNPKRFEQLIQLADRVSADPAAPENARELAEKLQSRRQELIDNWGLHSHLDESPKD